MHKKGLFVTRSVHPYMPNTAPAVREQQLAAVGVADVDDLFGSIPSHLRAPVDLGLPTALQSEVELRRYIETALGANTDTNEFLSFLGGGCSTHSVPAVCDEIARRGEFYSAMMGLGGASTTGAYQALFEYQSLICELVGLDLACLPLYDWSWAAGSAMVMSARATTRQKVLVADTVSPRRLAEITTRLAGTLEIVLVDHVAGTYAIDLDDLRTKSADAAALYLENPSYLGVLEPELDAIRAITAERGALLIAGVDPISLGVVREPGSYGADLACGDLQSLGTHPQFGGGAAGFLVVRHDDRLAHRLPSVYLGAFETVREGEYDFHWANFADTSFEHRGDSDIVIGCGSVATGITAAVYLSLMGPGGMRDLGDALRARVDYLSHRLTQVPGVDPTRVKGVAFKELVVDYSGTGLSVADVNSELLAHGIFGGIPLESDYPQLTGCALVSVTEKHTQGDLDRLADTLTEILR